MSIDTPTRENVVLRYSSADVDPFLSLGPPPGMPLDLAAGTEFGRFLIRRGLLLYRRLLLHIDARNQLIP